MKQTLLFVKRGTITTMHQENEGKMKSHFHVKKILKL